MPINFLNFSHDFSPVFLLSRTFFQELFFFFSFRNLQDQRLSRSTCANILYILGQTLPISNVIRITLKIFQALPYSFQWISTVDVFFWKIVSHEKQIDSWIWWTNDSIWKDHWIQWAHNRNPAGNYIYKVNNRNTRTKVWNMFTVNNKATKTTPIASFW